MVEHDENWARLRPAELLLLEDFGGKNSSILYGIFRFRSSITTSWAMKNIVQPVATHPRFRSVLDECAGKFVLDHSFNPSSHLTAVDVPLTSEELNRVISTSLRLDRPLWHVYLYPDDDGTDVLLQIHHVIGDGGGLVRFFLRSVLTPTPNNPTETHLIDRRPLHPTLVAAGANTTLLDGMTRPVRDLYSMLFGPFIRDARNPLNRDSAQMKGSKRVAFSRNRSVSTLMNACRRVGITINDLLLAAMSGAIQEVFPGVAMNLAVPKFMEHKDGELYNAVAIYTMRMPLHVVGRIHRIAACVRLMRDRKAGYRTGLCLVLAQILGLLPKFLRRFFWNRFTQRVTLAFTNVSGSPFQMRCGNHDVEDARVVAGGLAACGVIVTAFSYKDTLRVNLSTDVSKMDRPEMLMLAFDVELDRILDWIATVGIGAEK